MKDLSPKQNETYAFIKEYREMNGFSPTYKEIAEHFDLNQSTVHSCVDAMCRKGYVKVVPGAGRTITLVR